MGSGTTRHHAWGCTLRDSVQVKLECADEKGRQIMVLCLTQCRSPNDRNLLKIGSHLGDFANNLRSALNYTMRRFVDVRLRPLLAPGEFRSIRRRQDFPWSDSKGDFDNLGVVAQSRKHCAAVYNFLEGVQPYLPGNEWLRHLMIVSNTDKHEIINDIRDHAAVAAAFMNPDGTPHRPPGFFGPGLDRILVGGDPEPQVYLCPSYYYPFGGFAVKGGKWVFYLVPLDGVRLGLTRFVEGVPRRVKEVIKHFEELI